jgi:hypothetical protein
MPPQSPQLQHHKRKAPISPYSMPDIVTYAGIIHSILILITDYHLMIETRRGYIKGFSKHAYRDEKLRNINFVPLG